MAHRSSKATAFSFSSYRNALSWLRNLEAPVLEVATSQTPIAPMRHKHHQPDRLSLPRFHDPPTPDRHWIVSSLMKSAKCHTMSNKPVEQDCLHHIIEFCIILLLYQFYAM